MPLLHLVLPDLQATQRFGALLAYSLSAGDVIALGGGLGAGKSALARAVIQAANPDEADIPSPTFTLVQTYQMKDGTPIWHMDLYRIESVRDARELGLDDAFFEAVCLIEWPERLGDYLPKNNLSIRLNILPEDDDVACPRLAKISFPPCWAERINLIIQEMSKTKFS